MKKPYIKILGLFVIVLMMGLIFTSLKSSKKYKFDISAEEIHAELVNSIHYVNPNEVQEIISNKNKDYVFVDIRNPREYDNFHIESSINVPMEKVLNDEFSSFFENNKTKVLYCDNSLKSNQIRLLLTQFGYENILVLQGGANYWQENMISKDIFKSTPEFDDEKLKFDSDKLKPSE